jgi:lysophospholipase L1-like esterase
MQVRKTLALLLGVILLLILSSCAIAKDNPHLERIEWTDIWVVGADQSDLPRVLLVGDSITRGYFDNVDRALTGKAYCARYATSMFMSNPDYLEQLKMILKRYRFRVIHVNNGLHGWDYTEEQYRKALPPLMDTLKKYGNGAVVIWATTTPRRVKEAPTQFAPDTNRVKERNRVALDYMTRHGIQVDDLFNLVAEHPEYYSEDATHFNDQGKAVEGKQVSEAILKVLEN